MPEVLYQGKYYPICGHYFWDNNNGATIVCKMLGFDTGSYKKRMGKYNVDAMPVGDCKPGEKLTQCTGGGNAWGNFDDRDGWCKKGTKIGVEVICKGDSSVCVVCVRAYVCVCCLGKEQQRPWQRKSARLPCVLWSAGTDAPKAYARTRTQDTRGRVY